MDEIICTFGTCWDCCWCTVVILVVLLSLALLKYKRRIAVADDAMVVVVVVVFGTISESELYECVEPIGCRCVDVWSLVPRGPVDPPELVVPRNGMMTDLISKWDFSSWTVVFVVVVLVLLALHDRIESFFNGISVRFIDTAVIVSWHARSFFDAPTPQCDADDDDWERSLDLRGEKCVKIGELFFDDELLDPASVAFIWSKKRWKRIKI